jgi:hypothetical protein
MEGFKCEVKARRVFEAEYAASLCRFSHKKSTFVVTMILHSLISSSKKAVSENLGE